MISFKVIDHLDKRNPVAAGPISGHSHQKAIRKLISVDNIGEGGLVIGVDFCGVELATASYLKLTLLWLTLCGRLHAGALTASEQRTIDWATIEPLDVYPLALNASTEIRNEIDEVFARRGLPFVCVDARRGSVVIRGTVLGNVEPAIRRTLHSLHGERATTAEALHAKTPEERVNVTAWSNRLAELLRLRVARREKRGKTWLYQPIAETLSYG